MPALREIFADFGIEFDRRRALERGNQRVDRATNNLRRMDGVTDRLSGTIRGLGAALGSAAIAQTMRSLVSATVESTTELTRWADRLGISIQEMNSWSRVARRFGADTDDITDGLKELQLKARDAMTGTQSYIDAFALLGITVDQLRPVINDQTALMDLFTDALNRNTDAATQNFVVDELMSDAGTRLLPMFRQGTEEIRRMRMEADKASRDQLPALEKETRRYIAAQREWGMMWELTRNELVLRLLPVLTSLLRWASDASREFRELTQDSMLFESTLVAIGIGLGALLLATIGFWGPWAAGIAAVAGLALILDDIWVGLKGGKSLTEELIDDVGEVFGMVDAGARAFDRVNEAIKRIKIQLMEAYAFMGGLFAIPTMIDTDQFGAGQAQMLRRGQELRAGAVDIGGTVGRFLGLPRFDTRAQRDFQAQETGRAARARATDLAQGRFDPRVALRMLQPGGAPAAVSARQQGQTVNQRVNAPSNITVNVTEAQDAQATANTVRGEVSRQWQQQLRQVAAASVPNIGAGSGG